MRRPLSETTKLVLARALDWTLLEFEEAIVGENEDSIECGRRRNRQRQEPRTFPNKSRHLSAFPLKTAPIDA